MVPDVPAGTAAPAAPAAPATPATVAAPAAAPAAPATPPRTGTGTDAAIEAARKRLADRGGILPEPAAPAAPAEPAAPGAPAAEATTEAVPAAEAGEAPAEEMAVTEGAEAAEEPLLFAMPGLAERGEATLELEVPDKEAFDRLRRLENDAVVGRRFKQERTELTRTREKLEALQEGVDTDPTGFILQHAPEEVRADVAMQLLLDPENLTRINDVLSNGPNPTTLVDILSDPIQLQLWQANMRADRAEMATRLRTQSDEKRALRANATKVVETIHSVIPETLPEEQRDLLVRDAIRDVQERQRRLKLQTLDPTDVALIVGERLRQLGLTPAQPGQNGNGDGPAAPGKPAARQPAARTGKEFVEADAKRKAAAAAAPAGAGAPAAGARPELPKTTDERIEEVRRIGVRRALGMS